VIIIDSVALVNTSKLRGPTPLLEPAEAACPKTINVAGD
jgi:hypothetical protein